MKYVAKQKDQPISSIFLANKEYKADGDTIEVPDDHQDAHKAAALIGLEAAPAEEGSTKKPTKA